MLRWHKFSWFEISNEIERRFYQEVLSSAKLGKRPPILSGYGLSENAILLQTTRYLKRHPNLDTQTSRE